MLSQQFMDVLAEFGAVVGQNLTLDEDGITTFTIDDEIIVNLQYLEASDIIVAFAPVGAFGGTDAADAGEKALTLLRLCELGGKSDGFTLALDKDADLVLALDRRSALEIAAADSMAAWMEALIAAVREVREVFAAQFPTEGCE